MFFCLNISISKESIVDVYGVVKSTPVPVEGCNPADIELHVTKMFVISAAATVLPFQIEDAMRPDSDDVSNIDLNHFP